MPSSAFLAATRARKSRRVIIVFRFLFGDVVNGAGSLSVYGILCHHEGGWPMASMNVSGPDPMREWVQQCIDTGQYASVNDYVRDLIRRDQAQADEQKVLIAALIEGEQSGISKRRIPDILTALKQQRRSPRDE
jgi:antitoxin ParD1/3/4